MHTTVWQRDMRPTQGQGTNCPGAARGLQTPAVAPDGKVAQGDTAEEGGSKEKPEGGWGYSQNDKLPWLEAQDGEEGEADDEASQRAKVAGAEY